MFGRPYIGKYVSQAILCQTYGLAQMKKLPDLPKFCLVCLAGPALNNNTAVVSTHTSQWSKIEYTGSLPAYGVEILTNCVFSFKIEVCHVR